MGARIIDGKEIAAGVRTKVGLEVNELFKQHDLVPGLAVVIVGDDPASRIYVKNKVRMSQAVGIKSHLIERPVDISEAELLALVEQLNSDENIHGILVQLPLPRHINSQKIIHAIDPDKDVDGFHPINAGLLATGGDALVPCTPLGCMELLKQTMGSVSGMDALVIGRSNIVGKPVAQLLLRENATVTIAHSKTKDLQKKAQSADIIIAAVGQAELVRGSWIKDGAVILDVGMNRVASLDGASRLVGDVCFDEASKHAAAISPVPGGVGPMTIAFLLSNTIEACCRQKGIDRNMLKENLG